MKKIALLAFALIALSAQSAPVKLEVCKDQPGASLENVYDTRSFYSGQVTLFAYDTVEPAAASKGLAITYNVPTNNEQGFGERGCVALTYLNSVETLSKIKAAYNARTGLTLTIKGNRLSGDGDFKNTVITLNIRTVNTGRADEGQVVTADEK